MSMRRRSSAPDEPIAEVAARATEHHGTSMSVWLDAAVERSPLLEAGLSAVREWETEHGDLANNDELAWADGVLDMIGRQEAARTASDVIGDAGASITAEIVDAPSRLN